MWISHTQKIFLRQEEVLSLLRQWLLLPPASHAAESRLTLPLQYSSCLTTLSDLSHHFTPFQTHQAASAWAITADPSSSCFKALPVLLFSFWSSGKRTACVHGECFSDNLPCKSLCFVHHCRLIKSKTSQWLFRVFSWVLLVSLGPITTMLLWGAVCLGFLNPSAPLLISCIDFCLSFRLTHNVTTSFCISSGRGIYRERNSQVFSYWNSMSAACWGYLATEG